MDDTPISPESSDDSDDSRDFSEVESTDSYPLLPWSVDHDSDISSEAPSLSPWETLSPPHLDTPSQPPSATPSPPHSETPSPSLWGTASPPPSATPSPPPSETPSPPPSEASREPSPDALEDVDALLESDGASRSPGPRAAAPQPADLPGPPAKLRRLASPAPQDDDGETCPICLEPWASAGEHRLVALKCGHLFGAECVERWIRGKTAKDRCCPTCKARASLRDVRHIYAKRLVAVDAAELAALHRRVEAVQAEKSLVELELQTARADHRAAAQQLELLRRAGAGAAAAGAGAAQRAWRFALDRNLEAWPEGGCRVLAYNCRTYEFYVSQRTAGLFPGYGVRSVSGVDYALGPFLPLHPKAIRDVAYSQPTDLLMSVGLDGAARIVERGTPAATVQCGAPLWSCAWDHARPQYFYTGGVGGSVSTYDVRNTRASVHRVAAPGDMSPSVSLVSTEFGLLSCQLNSSWLWRSTAAGATPQPLPVRGAFVSLCYDRESRRAAVSCRPAAAERAKLAVFQLRAAGGAGAGGEVAVEPVRAVYGSARATVMSRAAFVRCAGAAWLAAYSESEAALVLHPADGGRAVSLPAADAALDVCAGQVNGETVLAALSESRLRLYKSYSTGSYS